MHDKEVCRDTSDANKGVTYCSRSSSRVDEAQLDAPCAVGVAALSAATCRRCLVDPPALMPIVLAACHLRWGVLVADELEPAGNRNGCRVAPVPGQTQDVFIGTSHQTQSHQTQILILWVVHVVTESFSVCDNERDDQQ